MESVSNKTLVVYGQVEKSYTTNNTETGKPQTYSEKITLYAPADKMEKSSKHAAKRNDTDNTRNNRSMLDYIRPAVFTAIPIADCIGKGAYYGRNTTRKTYIGMQTAKSWGAFAAAGLLFNLGAALLINNIKPLREYAQDNPNLTSAGVIVGSLMAGSSAAQYAFKNINVKSTFNKKLQALSIKFSKSKNYKVVVKKVSDFATSAKGQYTGLALSVAAGVILIHDLMNWDKPKEKYTD